MTINEIKQQEKNEALNKIRKTYRDAYTTPEDRDEEVMIILSHLDNQIAKLDSM